MKWFTLSLVILFMTGCQATSSVDDQNSDYPQTNMKKGCSA